MYPDWDSFCWHRIDLDNYDESSLEIAINAIKTKYPDISIPENAVRFGFEHSDMFIMELIPEDQKWSVVIDALREDGIDAKYFGQACA